jgi:thiamine biosynthesis protein ThiS
MPRILVKLYTTLKDRLNTPVAELEGATVSQVINALVQLKKPDTEQILLDENGLVKSHFVLTLNSQILDHKSIGQVKVKEGDILHIFPPVSGG